MTTVREIEQFLDGRAPWELAERLGQRGAAGRAIRQAAVKRVLVALDITPAGGGGGRWSVGAS